MGQFVTKLYPRSLKVTNIAFEIGSRKFSPSQKGDVYAELPGKYILGVGWILRIPTLVFLKVRWIIATHAKYVEPSQIPAISTHITLFRLQQSASLLATSSHSEITSFTLSEPKIIPSVFQKTFTNGPNVVFWP